LTGKIPSSKAYNKLGVNVFNIKLRAGYDNNNPSGTLLFYFIAIYVTARARFPPAESPVIITFYGSTLKYYLTLSSNHK
jgi:hypothetical protein